MQIQKEQTMKKCLFTIVILLLAFNILRAQTVILIDNKGNRNQTYPSVTETNSAIVEMINQVDTVNLYNDIDWMQQYVRDAAKPEALIVQNYLLDKFEEIGLETYIHNHTATIGGTDTLDAGNVIAIQPGTEFPDEYIIISSHYDHPDGPGADDNASGTAGVLECARILSQHSFKRSILYIPFNGEERWMVGSFPFAQKCARENMNILGVFNLDMIGFWPGAEYGDITMYSGYSYISQHLFEYYQQVANIYIPEMPTRRFSTMDSYGSDHMSFNIYEYPALYIGDIEYKYQNIHYHTPSDTIGAGVNCFALAQGFVKATIAAVAELADGWLAPQDFSAVVKDGEVFMSWNESAETESYKVFKDNEFLVETTENFYVDKNFVEGEWHRYYVKAVDINGMESVDSNPDSVFYTQPLQLPVAYDFDNGMAEGLTLNNDNWSFVNKGLKATTNTFDNIFQIAEFQWFPIADSIENVTFGLKIAKKLYPMWTSGESGQPYNVNVFVEATTDRKTWNKLAIITPSKQNQWEDFSISLNEYIGNEYVQVRIRYEGCGQGTTTISDNIIYLDDLYISFDDVGINDIPIQENLYLSVSPNPTYGMVNIMTGIEHPYNIYVYNVMGVRVFLNDSFSDGVLDLNHLPKGVYFITVRNGLDKISKRIVLK